MCDPAREIRLPDSKVIDVLLEDVSRAASHFCPKHRRCDKPVRVPGKVGVDDPSPERSLARSERTIPDVCPYQRNQQRRNTLAHLAEQRRWIQSHATVCRNRSRCAPRTSANTPCPLSGYRTPLRKGAILKSHGNGRRDYCHSPTSSIKVVRTRSAAKYSPAISRAAWTCAWSLALIWSNASRI